MIRSPGLTNAPGSVSFSSNSLASRLTESLAPTRSPFALVKSTCMCRKAIGKDSASRRSWRKTSWKCVAARTFGQSFPRSMKCLRTPQNKPAPSVDQATCNRKNQVGTEDSNK